MIAKNLKEGSEEIGEP